MIIFNNETGVIHTNVTIDTSPGGKPSYRKGLTFLYMSEHTVIKAGDTLTITNGLVPLMGKVNNITRDSFQIDNGIVNNFPLWKVQTDFKIELIPKLNIFNNKTGIIIANVDHSSIIGAYVNETINYLEEDHTVITAQLLTFGPLHQYGFQDRITKIENDVVYTLNNGSFHIDDIRVVDHPTPYIRVVDHPTPLLNDLKKMHSDLTDRYTSKFDKLQKLWKGDSQISKDIKLVNFIRLVDGDLSHIGDALLAGETIMVHGVIGNSMLLGNETTQYRIKKKQVSLTLDADLVDELLNRRVEAGPTFQTFSKLNQQIKDQLA